MGFQTMFAIQERNVKIITICFIRQPSLLLWQQERGYGQESGIEKAAWSCSQQNPSLGWCGSLQTWQRGLRSQAEKAWVQNLQINVSVFVCWNMIIMKLTKAILKSAHVKTKICNKRSPKGAAIIMKGMRKLSAIIG